MEENAAIPYAALSYTCHGQIKCRLRSYDDWSGVVYLQECGKQQRKELKLGASALSPFIHRASEANYGGRVTDAHDRITIANLITDYYCDDILKARGFLPATMLLKTPLRLSQEASAAPAASACG